MDFGDFDTNRDNMIQKTEFRSVFMDNYTDDWNVRDDAGLDDEDFYTTTYYIIDRDNDNLLMKEEWDMGYNYYYGDYLTDDFTMYDLNRDNYISHEEYVTSLRDTDYFLMWDVDRNQYLSESELADRVFEIWDTNDDGIMSQTEFQRLDRHLEDL